MLLKTRTYSHKLTYFHERLLMFMRIYISMRTYSLSLSHIQTHTHAREYINDTWLTQILTIKALIPFIDAHKIFFSMLDHSYPSSQSPLQHPHSRTHTHIAREKQAGKKRVAGRVACPAVPPE